MDDDFTNLGYIQKDTRQFVLLGRIEGFLDGTKKANGVARTWDGTATQFTSYNSNFTLEHALWMQQRYNEGNFTANVPFNLSGGIPADRHPDDASKASGSVPGSNAGQQGGDDDNQGTPQDPPDGNPGFPPELMGYPWGEDPEDMADPEDIVDMSDDELADQEPPLIRDPNGDIRPMTEDEKNNHDAKVLGLSPEDWNKIGQAFDAGMLAMDVIAVLGVIFPEPSSSIAGAALLARRMAAIRKAWKAWSRMSKKGGDCLLYTSPSPRDS